MSRHTEIQNDDTSRLAQDYRLNVQHSEKDPAYRDKFVSMLAEV